MTTTLITGANGFIASEIVGQLLERGQLVIGTARNEERSQGLRETFSKEISKGQLSIYYVNLTDENPFQQVFQDNSSITRVIHAASALPSAATTDLQTSVIDPAYQGTQSVLQAIADYAPQVERFILTSSMSAVRNPHVTLQPYTFSSKDWNSVTLKEALQNSSFAYGYAKKAAELAAWDFVEENKVNFSLKVINPPYVLGPYRLKPKCKQDILKGSNGVLFKGVDSQIEWNRVMSYASLATTATAHINAADPSVTDKKNHRYPICDGYFTVAEATDILRQEFPQHKDEFCKFEGDHTFEVVAKIDSTEATEDLKLPVSVSFKTIVKQVGSDYFDQSTL